MKLTRKNVARAVGKKIKAMREGRGIPASAVADIVGVDRANYYRLEGGNHLVRLDTMLRIASFLGCPASELLP